MCEKRENSTKKYLSAKTFPNFKGFLKIRRNNRQLKCIREQYQFKNIYIGIYLFLRKCIIELSLIPTFNALLLHHASGCKCVCQSTQSQIHSAPLMRIPVNFHRMRLVKFASTNAFQVTASIAIQFTPTRVQFRKNG